MSDVDTGRYQVTNPTRLLQDLWNRDREGSFLSQRTCSSCTVVKKGNDPCSKNEF